MRGFVIISETSVLQNKLNNKLINNASKSILVHDSELEGKGGEGNGLSLNFGLWPFEL